LQQVSEYLPSRHRKQQSQRVRRMQHPWHPTLTRNLPKTLTSH